MASSASGQDDQIPHCDSLPHPFSSRNMILPKSELVHESFLSQNILRGSKKIFCQFSVGTEQGKRENRIRQRERKQRKQNCCRVSRAYFQYFATKTGKHKSKNTKRHEGLECHIISPRSLSACIWTETKSRSIKRKMKLNLRLPFVSYFRRPCWSADYLRAWFYCVYGGVIIVVRCDKCVIYYYLRRLTIVLGLGSSRANHACQSRDF